MKKEVPKSIAQQMLASALSSFLRTQDIIDNNAAMEGRDPHTGTNAWLTLSAMEQAVKDLDSSASWQLCMETVFEAGIKNASGGIGILLTSTLISFCDRLKSSETLLEHCSTHTLIEMLSANPWDMCIGSTHFDRGNKKTMTRVIEKMHRHISNDMSHTEVFSTYALLLMEMLIETGSGGQHTPFDSHFVCITLLANSCASALEETDSLTNSLHEMLTDLVPEKTTHHTIPDNQKTSCDHRFIVEMVISSTSVDLEKITQHLNRSGAYYVCTGGIDPFNVGTWRLYIETDNLTALYPKSGFVLHFQVRDARPDDVIGEDGLAAEFLGRGTQLLESRRPRRAQRVVVYAMTRCVGLVQDLAQTGATVVLHPQEHVRDYLVSGRLRSSSGIQLLVPCDAQSREGYVEQINAHGDPSCELVAESTNELAVLDVTRACARLFDPEDQYTPVERQGLTRHMLLEVSSRATEKSRVVALPSTLESLVTPRVFDLIGTHPHHLRLLVGCADGEGLVGIVRQVLATTMKDGLQLEVIDGGHIGSSILQGHR